jgi:hypothetical protein
MTIVYYTPEEDRLLLRLRADGLRWYEIAERLPGRTMPGASQRHAKLIADGFGLPAREAFPVAPTPAQRSSAEDLFIAGAEDGSKRLLRAQIRAGQVFGKQRAEWLARHEGAAA